MKKFNHPVLLLCFISLMGTDSTDARMPRSFFSFRTSQIRPRDSTEYSFCRVKDNTNAFACLHPNFCTQEGGINRGPCGEDEVCCEVVKFCGSTTSAQSLLFRNPAYPTSEEEDRACILTIKIAPSICALRLDNEVLELSPFDDEYCPKDSLTILGSRNLTSPICGNMTGYSTTFEVVEYQKVTLALVLQGKPAYRFSIQITMIPCEEVVVFKSIINAGRKNLHAPKYKLSLKNSTSSGSASGSNGTNATASQEPTSTPAKTNDSADSSTSSTANPADATTESMTVGVPLPTVSAPTTSTTDTNDVDHSSTSSTGKPTASTPIPSKNGTNTTELAPVLPILVTVPAPVYEKGCYRNNTLPMIVSRSLSRTPKTSLHKKRYEEVLREKFGAALDEESSEEETLKCSIWDEGEKRFRNELQCDSQDDPSSNKFRIIGGTYANVGEYPWQVALIYKTKYFCSGSLITDRHVLTAGHCLFGSLGLGIDHITVLIGDFDLKSKTDTHSLAVGVKKIMWNAHYNPVTIENDIALLEICKPVEFSDTIGPIRLPINSDYDYNGRHATITGWGRFDRKLRKSSHILKEYHSTVVNFSYCEKTWNIIPGISAYRHMHICLNITKGTPCYGDSGGPLVTCEGSACTQIGIVSFSFPKCVDVGLPAVFTAVSNFKRWIDLSLTSIFPTYQLD